MNISNVKMQGNEMTANFTTRPLTSEIWRDFETVLGKHGGCYGCWCTHFRMDPAQRKIASSEDRNSYMCERVEKGPPPGLIGYLADEPVGWVQVTPRLDIPRWNTPRTVSRPLDDADAENSSVWAISCFFIRSPSRGKGLSHLLLAAAVDFSKEAGASVVEACPITRTKQSKSVGLYVGSEQIFRQFGFEEVARRKEGRPLMRYRFQ